MIGTTSTVCLLRRAPAFILSSFPLVLLLVASAARADTMTYNILPNPQPDLNNGFTDTVSGTITVSNSAGSAIGTFDSSNDSTVELFADFTMTSTDPLIAPVTAIADVPLATAFVSTPASQLFATPTSLSVGLDTYLSIDAGGGMLGDTYVEMLYDTHDSPGAYYGVAGIQGPPETMQFENHDADAFLVSGEWAIAAVPEPTTLMLLAPAVLGLGVVALRRRRTVAA